MPREKEDFRENLSRIEAAFPGGEKLGIPTVYQRRGESNGAVKGANVHR